MMMLLLLAGAVGAGCNVDMKWVKENITQMIVEQWPDAEVDSVDCPEQVAKQKGSVFKCTVKLKDGGTLPFRVKQTDDSGSVEVEAEKKIFVRQQLAEMITQAAKDKATGKADCGKGIFAIDKTTPIECELPGVGTVLVTLEESGKVTWELKDKAQKDSPGKPQQKLKK